jgi:hypothetical protein
VSGEFLNVPLEVAQGVVNPVVPVDLDAVLGVVVPIRPDAELAPQSPTADRSTRTL